MAKRKKPDSQTSAQTEKRTVRAPDDSEQRLAEVTDDVVPARSNGGLPIVGLGGSAGSIQALQAFFAAMPADSGMAFVVVMHLSAEHESTLAELLQRSTAMPVTQVRAVAKVEANHVYVIPPAKSLVATDGYLSLGELSEQHGKRMAVDIFFRTLADTLGPHAAAVVLSGADGDGAIGIKRMKERGGLTVAQDPDEAEHPSMPRTAIATGMVDWVLPVADMPARLIEYRLYEKRIKLPPEDGPQPAAAARSTSSQDETALRDILIFLRTRTGRDFTYYKRATILRRIARRMQVNSVEDLVGYLAVLRAHTGEASALLQDLLISVTNFFRDQDTFRALESHIPALFRDKGPEDALRVWVPACATGEEAYSIAMLLAEHAQTLDAPPIMQVFATDLDETIIRAARNAAYPDTISADVSEERLRRFFIKEHHGYRVRRELREIVLFAMHDLLKDSPFSRLDLISCRNLLIYLDRDAQARAFDIFNFALHAKGMLFLGASESIDDNSSAFSVLDKKNRIYLHRTTPKMGLSVPTGPSTLLRALEGKANQQTTIAGATFPPVEQILGPIIPNAERGMSWGGLHARLVDRLAPPSVVINHDHEIVHLSEQARRYLQFPSGEPTHDLLRVVHPMLRIELRAALYRAAQTGAPAGASEVPCDIDGTCDVIDISVIPVDDIAPDFMLVTFKVRSSNEPTPKIAPPRSDAEPAAQHLEHELERMKSYLRDTVEQYEASTEELKASNEELQAMNEELRSATEELETSREELQSINEELSTVNQELKGKVDELGRANSDLHNLMASTAIATVFLDRDLCITRYTPSAVGLFNLIPTDVGRPLSDLTHSLDYEGLEKDAQQVLEQLVPIEREIGQGGGRWFLARLLPYRTAEDRIAGVVLTFVDLTDLRDTRAALKTSEERYRDLFNSIDEGFALLEMITDKEGRTDFRYLEVNPAFEQQSGLTNVVGKTILEVIPGTEPTWIHRFERVVQTGEALRFQDFIAALQRWFDVFAFRVGGNNSKKIAVIFTDVTARRTADSALTRAHENLEERIAERTDELSTANTQLRMEVKERKREDLERLKLMRDLATAQEDERSRISRELHDSLGQHLAALTIGLKTVEMLDGCPSDVRELVRKMRDTAGHLDEEVDRLSYELRPLALSDLGLYAALHRHVEAWSQDTGITVDSHIKVLEDQRFTFMVDITIYRIMQEALTNVRKHAGATRVSIIAERRRDDLRLIIEDNGQGFDVESVFAGTEIRKLGVRGMRERAALVGGDLQIESAAGQGTAIYLTVPIEDTHQVE